MYVRGGCTYITTNRPHGVLYVGVTSDLIGRIAKHKRKHYPDSFSARYNVDQLVYYECFPTIMEAIAREKQLKGGNRAKARTDRGIQPAVGGPVRKAFGGLITIPFSRAPKGRSDP